MLAGSINPARMIVLTLPFGSREFWTANADKLPASVKFDKQKG